MGKRIEKTKNLVIGKHFTVNCGWSCEIIDYFGRAKVLVRWENDGSEQLVRMDVLRSGELKPTNCEIDRSNRNLIDEFSKEFFGKEFKVACGWTCLVTSYEGKNKIGITWKEDGSKQVTNSTSLRKLTTVPNNKRIYGVGLNDMVGKPHNKEYLKRWRLMLMRCYLESYQKINPTYRGVVVCEEWKTFSNFHNWCESWGDIKGLSLDKDSGGKRIYSPETCVFVTSKLNSAMVMGSNKNYRFRGGSYEVSCAGRYVGSFKTQEDATSAFKKAKKLYIEKLLEEYKIEPFYDIRTEMAILGWCRANLE